MELGAAAAWLGQLWVGLGDTSPVPAVNSNRVLGKFHSCRQPQFPTCEMARCLPSITPGECHGHRQVVQWSHCVPSLQCCQTLVSHHVNPFLRDEDGYTAADLAEYHGHQDCAQFLREIGRPVSFTVPTRPRRLGDRVPRYPESQVMEKAHCICHTVPRRRVLGQDRVSATSQLAQCWDRAVAGVMTKVMTEP